jgi:hypothetical protein
MAGCLTTGMACLRLNRPCILVERQTGAMLDNAQKRLRQCYRYFKDVGLLPAPGMEPKEPQPWELSGETWMHEAQYWFQQVHDIDTHTYQVPRNLVSCAHDV